MFYLVANILLNTLLAAIFKVFPRYRIDAFQAIVVNYVTCVITGSIFLGRFPLGVSSVSQGWSPWALLMGLGFISIFNLQAYCTKVDGITTSTIANKLSLVIPVLFSVYLYSEHLGYGKILGIVLAFPAVYLSTRVQEDGKKQELLWPVLLFVGSGLLDTVVKFVEQRYLNNPEIQQVYTIHVFSVAAMAGVTLAAILTIAGKIKLSWRNVVAGICVGIPNYFSIYFFIRMLNSHLLQSSAAIPVNNIGILAAASLTAIVFFREKATIMRVVGLVLSVIAILLIAFTR
ncbi:MAG: EamA family transporter [Bacteroidota bacterium]